MTINRKFFIAGVQFRGQEAISAISGFEEGQILTLETEPTNKYDPNAIKIVWEDEMGDSHHLGYVPKALSAEISAAIEIEPLICIVTSLNIGAKPWELCEVCIRSFNEDEDLPTDDEIDEFEDDDYEEPVIDDNEDDDE